jgi:hypothetical protein
MFKEFNKKSLKIPKGQSESIYRRRTDNTMAKRKSPTAFFSRMAGAVGPQRALHTQNSGFAAATLRRHISTFRGYQILFSIRNPYINRFTNHISSQHGEMMV